MDYHAKEEMVVDQFLLGMGNHEYKWLPMGTDEWGKYSEWLDHWRLSKKMKTFIL